MAGPKERVRVQAGREGGPKQALPSNAVTNIPMPAVQTTRGVRAPTTLYEAIIQAARDPAVDVAKMKALADLQMQMEGNEARKAFTRAFNALQFELPTIDKDGLIDHGEGTTARGNKKLKTRYSTYPNLMRVCRPLLKKHGFTFNNTIEPTDDGAKIVVVGYLTHVDGEVMKSKFPLGADAGPGRSAAQGWGSASSYGKRYNLILLLDIVSEAPQDLDNDGFRRKGDVESQVEVLVNDEQAALIREAVQSCGVGLEKFCAKFGVKSISDLSASKFNDAMKACKNYAQEIEKRAAKPVQDDRFPGDRDR